MMYTVKIEGFVLGTYRKVGETISLTAAQAKTFLREGRVEAKDVQRRAAAPKAEPKAG